MPEKFENCVFTLKTHQTFSIQTMRVKFGNSVFRLKTLQTFFVKTMPEKLEKATIKTLAGKSQDYSDVDVFEKLCFPCTLKRKPGVYKFLCFRDGLVWTVGLTVEI